MTQEEMEESLTRMNDAKRDLTRILLVEVAYVTLGLGALFALRDSAFAWVLLGIGIFAGVSSIIRDLMVSLGKAQARKSRYLWVVLSLQALCIPLILLSYTYDNTWCHVCIIIIVVFQLLSILLDFLTVPKK